MLTLIENGEAYAPEPLVPAAVLLPGGRILKRGAAPRPPLVAPDVEAERIDATPGVVVPGLIDPHERLLGGSGEDGFATQTPEIHLHEIVAAGVTTVVGVLGVDTTMKTMPGLLARAKALREMGLSAFLWTG